MVVAAGMEMRSGVCIELQSSFHFLELPTLQTPSFMVVNIVVMVVVVVVIFVSLTFSRLSTCP